jgi:hypothetical protein
MRAPPPHVVALAALVLVLAVLLLRDGAVRLTLARDALGNEALVVGADDGALYMIDTAYAGAPVLSTSYLSVQRRCGAGLSAVGARYAACVAALRSEVGEDARHAAVRRLLEEGRCRAYTSGCTMRLMGIGATSEAQADMLLCPGLRFRGGSRREAVDADIFVTNPLPGSVHILTTDYLLHRAPCVIRPGAAKLHLRVPPVWQSVMRPSFAFFPAVLVGGAFAIPMTVGGAALQIVVDTGAAAPLSLGSDAIARVKLCALTGRRATQSGVHGERVCSDILRAAVRIGDEPVDGLDLGQVEVFAMEQPVAGADGYVGIGLLRAFDIWLQPDAIGFRPSGLSPRGVEASAEGSCGRDARPACAA